MSTTCAKCGSNSFEMVTTSADGMDSYARVVQCKGCGNALGLVANITSDNKLEDVVYQLNQISNKIDQIINTKIYSIEQKVNRIESELGNVSYNLQIR